MTESLARILYDQISATKHVTLRRDLETAAIAYAHWRAQWALAAYEERREMETTRTAAHNAFIDSCSILSRAMARSGEDFSWRSTLGDERKLVGDFACYLHCLLAIAAR
jgi:hypothetical protein